MLKTSPEKNTNLVLVILFYFDLVLFSARSGAVLTGTQYRHFYILLLSVPALFLAYRYFSLVAGTLPLTEKA